MIYKPKLAVKSVVFQISYELDKYKWYEYIHTTLCFRLLSEIIHFDKQNNLLLDFRQIIWQITYLGALLDGFLEYLILVHQSHHLAIRYYLLIFAVIYESSCLGYNKGYVQQTSIFCKTGCDTSGLGLG